MPDRMPEDMPDKMPEDMSGRMPEDLPVTKRIDVMVGITRSKVFFTCFCSWLELVPLFSCRAFLLRLNQGHPPLSLASR